MNHVIDLKELERKAFKSYFEDGLWDIFIAMMLLSIAVSVTLSDMGVADSLRISLYVPLMFSGPAIIGLGKKCVTIPRMGLVKFGNERKMKIAKLHLLILISVILTAFLLMFTLHGSSMENLGFIGDHAGDLIIAALFIMAFGGIGYYLDFQRMYIYGFLLAFVNNDQIFQEMNTEIPPGIPAFILSILVLGYGIRTLTKFLNEYPLPNEKAGELDG